MSAWNSQTKIPRYQFACTKMLLFKIHSNWDQLQLATVGYSLDAESHQKRRKLLYKTFSLTWPLYKNNIQIYSVPNLYIKDIQDFRFHCSDLIHPLDLQNLEYDYVFSDFSIFRFNILNLSWQTVFYTMLHNIQA